MPQDIVKFVAFLIIVACEKGGIGKTLLAEIILDLLALAGRPRIVVQIDDQDRLARTIGQEVISIDTATLRQSRNNPSAGLMAFRPLMTALETAASNGSVVVLDIGATQTGQFATFAALADLDIDLAEMGIHGIAFVPAVAEPEALAQACRTLAMLAKALPNVRQVIVENERDGRFVDIMKGSEAAKLLNVLRRQTAHCPTVVMPAIEGQSWRHFESSYCRPLDVVAMDIPTVMKITGLPRSEARICRGDVASWVGAMEVALAPIFDIGGSQ